MYAGFDPELAGCEIGQYLRQHRASRIGLFTETASMTDASLFLQGFRAVYRTDDPSVTVIDCPNHQIDLRAFEFFEPDTS